MGEKETQILFRIKEVESLPLVRMANYLKCLSKALGNHRRVHLTKLYTGSMAAELTVDQGYEVHVWNRVKYPHDHANYVQNNLRNIEIMLREDGVSASLECPVLDDRIELATEVPILVETYGPFFCKTTIEGQVIKVGVGTRRKTPGRYVGVDLLEVSTRTKYHCTAPTELTRKLRAYLFEAPIRVVGQARWERTEKEEWRVNDLVIERYEELKHDKDGTSLNELRALADPPPGMDPFGDYGRTHGDGEEED